MSEQLILLLVGIIAIGLLAIPVTWYVLAVACILTMLASIVHFQILLALLALAGTIVCFVIGNAIAEAH